jgi:hypothetical protein
MNGVRAIHAFSPANAGEKVAEGRMRGLLFVLLLLSPTLFAATEKRLDGGPKPIIVRPAERTVTIDVKDAEAKVILAEMKKQCGIKNLIIDPGVEAKGTFYFHEVPCRQAFGVVLRSMGLDSITYTNSLITVGNRRD